MALLPPVVATLLADTREYRAQMDKAIEKTLQFAGVSEKTSRGASAALGVLAKGIAPIGAALAYGTDLALKYSENIDKLRTQTNATKAEADAAGRAILSLAANTGATQQQLFDGMIQIEKVGIRGAAAQNLLTEATKGSITSGSDLATTIGTLIAAQKLNIDGLGNAHQAMALFNAAISDSNMSMQDLQDSLSGRALAALQGYHISLKDTVAALETLANAGIKGTAASMQLSMMFNKLETPAKHVQDVLKKIGLTQGEVAAGLSKPGGVVSTFELLRDRAIAAGVPTNQLSAYFAQLFGSGRTGAGAMLLLNNIDQTKKHLDNLGASTKDYNQKVTEALSSPAQQFKKLKETFNTALTQLGTVTLPIAVRVVQWLTDIAKNKSLMEGLAGLFVAGVAAKMVKSVKDAFDTVKSVVGSAPMQLNTDALGLNTAAINRLTLAMGGEVPGLAAAGGAAGEASTVGAVAGMGAGAALGVAGFAGGVAVLSYMASHNMSAQQLNDPRSRLAAPMTEQQRKQLYGNFQFGPGTGGSTRSSVQVKVR